MFLAGDIERSLEHLGVLDNNRLATADLERALPLELDMVEVVRGAAAAAPIISRAIEAAGDDPRRRALVLALASDPAYGAPAGRRAAAIEAIRCAELAGEVAAPALHRALTNLVAAKVTGGEGLDTGLLGRAACLEPGLSPLRLHDTADLHLGLWSRFVD